MELHSYLAPTDDPRGSVLLAHGYAEHHQRYGEFRAALQEAGYDVWAGDFAAHGEAAGPRGTRKRGEGRRGSVNVGRLIAEHLDARRDVINEGRSHRLFLFGHSMGGLVSLASALIDPSHLVAVAVTGPALRPFPRTPYALARLGEKVGALLPWLRVPGTEPTHLTHDDGISAQRAADPLVVKGNAPLLTGASMAVQGRNVLRTAPLLVVPTLILHAEQDDLADPTASAEFRDAAPDRVELRIRPGVYHELLHEVDRAETTAEIVDWYNQW